ncbi:glycosyltransferase family 32 protein [Butyrivibrio sp. MB2005]|uniref:glycosyltransferase family 32 protein n=1 Tax=Butyrivibrio sp. MB2005 TaxID=1280678 RepID=UPI0018CB6CD2|nr:glycosyltransferase [Butyrivibrio sp. MB2005]
MELVAGLGNARGRDMLRIIKSGPCEFIRFSKNKDIYVFGAGRALDGCIDVYFEERNIERIIDNNEKLWGKSIKHNGKSVPICGINEFVTDFVNKKVPIQSCILFVSSTFYAVQIVEQLDQIKELDGVYCYVRAIGRSINEFYDDFEFSCGSQLIPKKIHYIWIGGKKLPYEYEKNIYTWKCFNPDYEIIKWDEHNYDFKKDRYTREAYDSCSWGFVPNLARLDIVCSEGGIYLDTDVEVVSNFDKLLHDNSFFCMGSADNINQGCGFGGVKDSEIIHQMVEAFKKEIFYHDGKPEKKPCHTFIHPILKRNGFKIENRYQNINGNVIYPTEVMSPLMIDGICDNVSGNTVSIHHSEGSWRSVIEKQEQGRITELVSRCVSI